MRVKPRLPRYDDVYFEGVASLEGDMRCLDGDSKGKWSAPTVKTIHRASPAPWYHEGAYVYDADNKFVAHFAFPYPSKENIAAMLEAINRKEKSK